MQAILSDCLNDGRTETLPPPAANAEGQGVANLDFVL